MIKKDIYIKNLVKEHPESIKVLLDFKINPFTFDEKSIEIMAKERNLDINEVIGKINKNVI